MRPKDDQGRANGGGLTTRWPSLAWRSFQSLHPPTKLLVGIVLLSFALLAFSSAGRRRTRERGTTFFILGDFGVDDEDPEFRSNLEDAKRVSNALLKVAEAVVWPRGLLLTGDLAYPSGISSSTDTRIDRVFGRIPIEFRNRVDFFATPGNHDCEGSIDAWLQVRRKTPHWIQPNGGRAYGENIFQLPSGGRLRLITLETCTLVCTPLAAKGPLNFRCGEKMEKFSKGSAYVKEKREQIAWMRSIEPKQKDDWIVVLGHWPVFSFRGNGPTRELLFVLEWMRNIRADVYFSGHDHALQYILGGDPRDPTFLVSGAGGYPLHASLKADSSDAFNIEGSAKLIHAQDANGFMTLTVDGDGGRVRFFDMNGTETYYTTLTRRP